MLARHFILATAGHVDHGKSALVKALTGTDPDRLPEEKARGITIELGFARLQLPGPGPGPEQDTVGFDLGVVDVPGHEDFVKNMVAGVGTIDLALLVVAADDGWMPQTEEHIQILEYLGVTQAVVGLTKIDLCGDRLTTIDAIRQRLAGTPFESAPIVPTSVVTGEGLDELRATLAHVLRDVPRPVDAGKPRLPVDRAFSLPGIGTIVTGTLTGGSLTRQQAVVIQPTGRVARIRALQRHGQEVDSAGPGMRVALSIPEIPLSAAEANGIARGHVVTVAALGPSARTIDVELRRIGRSIGERAGTDRPLKDGTRVRLHHGSANAAGRVLLGAPLAAGARAIARIRLEEPLFVSAGDRFILRDWPEQTTLAGGLILDLDPSPGLSRTEERTIFLRHRAEHPGHVDTWVESVVVRDRCHLRDGLLANSRFGAVEIEGAVARLIASGHLVAIGPFLATAEWWRQLRERATDHVRQEHQAHPERAGIALTSLRHGMSAELVTPELFDLLVTDLCRDRLHRDQTSVRLRSHRPTLPPELQAAGAGLRARLSLKPLEPPARKELAPDPVSQQALRFLIDTAEAISVSPELVLQADAISRARELIGQHVARHGPATASDLRQALGTNRRVIIPLLEYLDRAGFTIRVGDRRHLRE